MNLNHSVFASVCCKRRILVDLNDWPFQRQFRSTTLVSCSIPTSDESVSHQMMDLIEDSQVELLEALYCRCCSHCFACWRSFRLRRSATDACSNGDLVHIVVAKFQRIQHHYKHVLSYADKSNCTQENGSSRRSRHHRRNMRLTRCGIAASSKMSKMPPMTIWVMS